MPVHASCGLQELRTRPRPTMLSSAANHLQNRQLATVPWDEQAGGNFSDLEDAESTANSLAYKQHTFLVSGENLAVGKLMQVP